MKGLTIVFTLMASTIFSQLDIKPFIKVGGSFNVYRYGIFTSIDANIVGGVHFNDYVGLGLGVNSFSEPYARLDILTFVISPSYRVLNSEHIFSPVIGLDLGSQLWSNANGKFVWGGYQLSSTPHYDDYNERYKRTNFVSKVKLLADFKVKSFNISIGPTFNLICIILENVNYTVLSTSTDRRIGLGGELSLMYTFPMKKQAAKKALE